MDKIAAIQNFFSQFLPAYEENAIIFFDRHDDALCDGNNRTEYRSL